MSKEKIILIACYTIPLIALVVSILNSWSLSALSALTILIIETTYFRAKEYFNNKAPGRYISYANYAIGYTLAVATTLVAFFLVRHAKLDTSLFNSLYVATIITGLIVAITLFIMHLKTHAPGSPKETRIDAIFISFSVVFLLAITIFTYVADINFAM